MPFLSVYTPTYRRPGLLARCEASVAAQTEPVQHLIVRDEIGIGVAGMFAAIADHAEGVAGDYVMVLSDDNVLADPWFAAELRARSVAMGAPPVIVFKGQCGPSLQPLVWGREPEITRIDLSCFAVRRQLWLDSTDLWGHRYEGDFDFIHALWQQGHRFDWFDRLAFRALQISNGVPE